MPGFVRSAWALPLAALTIAGTGTLAQSGASSAEATVTVDFDKSRGANLRPERYNNIGRSGRWVEQRDADVAFFNANGLHGKAYRIFVITNELYDPATGKYDYSSATDWLSDVSRLSDEILIVLDSRVQLRDRKETREQIRPHLKRILLDLKKMYPQIKYVEAFNEPDHNLVKVLTPESLYDYYKDVYEIVNEVNRELKPASPLKVGGPAYMFYNEPWLRAFLDRYKADPSPNKRLDFVSWHEYGEFPAGTGDAGGPRAYRFYKTDPSEVASHRIKFNEEMRSRGLNVNTPSFITEIGIYPGPSFDNQNDPRPDYLIGAAGVSALTYWMLESPNNYPFNWVMRHGGEERKDQLISRAGPDKKTPLTNTFSPYGNSLGMMAKLKDERVAVQSNTLKAGKGVYAIATKDGTGAAVMVWNYQHTGSQAYRTTINFGQLPPTLRGKPLRQRMYRIDDKLSNYWANPATANLQQVSDTTVQPGQRHTVNVDLTPNALQLVVLEPAIGSGKRK
jgi:hypothetical protein